MMLLCCFWMKEVAKSPNQPLKLDISDVYGSTDGFYYNNHPDMFNLAEIYRNVLDMNDVTDRQVSEPTHYVLQYGKQNLAKYIKNLVVGGAFDSLNDRVWNLTAWHNSASVHSMPMSILLMQTALLRYVSSNSYHISLTVVPFATMQERYKREEIDVLNSTRWSDFFTALAFTFLSLNFILPRIQEAERKVKLLQFMNGVSAPMYWISNFLWDYLVYVIVCIFMIIPPAILFPSAFVGTNSKNLGPFLVVLFLYGWASLPLGYIVSILVKRKSRGLSIFITLSVAFGILTVSLLSNLFPLLFMKGGIDELKKLDHPHWFFLLFPTYAVSSGVRSNFQIAFHNNVCSIYTEEDLLHCKSASFTSTPILLQCCKDLCTPNPYGPCHKDRSYFSWENASNGPAALYLGLEGILFFGILFLLETRIASKMFGNLEHFQRMAVYRIQAIFRQSMRHRLLREDNTIEDSQVHEEKERIQNSNISTQRTGGEALIVLGLSKRHGLFSAVDRLTFGVKAAECFGILGVNGVGKTSTFRMLTGEDVPSEGNAFTKSFSLVKELRKYQSQMGYCPEVDSFLDEFTGREMILFFGQLRGLRGFNLYNRINELIKSLELTKCADELTHTYSARDKRKLSVAISLVGSPPLLLLDEPTSRMDLPSCRLVRKAIAQEKKISGAAVLLATQSIEESEVLCDRLAIMVGGRFSSLGSCEQLKSKCGQGFTLKLKISKENQHNIETVNALQNLMQNSLKEVILQDSYQGILRYHMMNPTLTFGDLFKLMSDVNGQFELEDYSIGVITLEQALIHSHA